jgi:hypothetical protein
VSQSVAWRSAVLRRFGAGADDIARLLPLTSAPLAEVGADSPGEWPFADEGHLATWRRYAQEAERDGTWAVLERHLVQLRLPVRAGISQTPEYRRATLQGRRGETIEEGLQLQRPERLHLTIVPTLAGHLPALIAPEREDFETLVRALTCRHEPVPVPPPMGACLVRGLVNWERVASHRRQWQVAQPLAMPGAWERELERLRSRPELYQDRLLLLSTGPYSGIAAEQLGVHPGRWLEMSLAIRQEHEGAHYVTLRLTGQLRSSPADELLADWLGLVRATGGYPPGWAARFLGLDGHGTFRAGGRLEGYLGESPLPDSAFSALCALLSAAIEGLAALEPPTADLPDRQAELFLGLARRSLEELATDLPRGTRRGHD